MAPPRWTVDAQSTPLEAAAPPTSLTQYGGIEYGGLPVYAIPSLGVEKEFAQAAGRADSAGLTDRETAQAVLSDPANRYLARQLCWVLTIEGIDTYLLIPRDATDLELLIDAIRPAPSPLDIDVVIGTLGPLAGPDLCNGLSAPMVALDQIYSFDTEGFLAAIPRPQGVAAKEFKQASEDIFRQICQIADNSGGPAAIDGVIFHTDRGSTYTATVFTTLCRKLRVSQSMGRVGSCFDNAAAEAYFSTLEHEVLSRHHFTTKAHARQVVVAWCHDFYNSRRRHSSAALMSPIQYERLAADQPAAA